MSSDSGEGFAVHAARAPRQLPALRPRTLVWILPIVTAAYLVTVHFRLGYFGLPYWACLALPLVALLGPWIIIGAATGDELGGSAPRALVIAIAVAVLLVAASALPLHLVPHAPLGRRDAALLGVGAVGLVILGGSLGAHTRRLPGPLDVLLALVVAAMIETDLYVTSYWFDRDFLIFLRAGEGFLAHRPVYIIEPPAVTARDPSLGPFVYPPVTLPLFGGLAMLGRPAAEVVWLGLALGSVVVSLRLFGVRWRWIPVLLLWPPIVQGLFVGNADVVVLVFFAALPLAGSLIAIPPLVKVQLGVPAIWLAVERRWADVARAAAIGLGLVLLTLPLVGPGLWASWLHQLAGFAAYTEQHPPVQGIALQRSLGPLVAGIVGLGVILVALLQRGRDRLASLGLASLAVSPTLYPHGVTLGLPGLLRLRASVLWLAMAVTSTVYGTTWWWVALAVALVAPMVGPLRHATAPDPEHHPLGAAPGPWPMPPARDPDPRPAPRRSPVGGGAVPTRSGIPADRAIPGRPSAPGPAASGPRP